MSLRETYHRIIPVLILVLLLHTGIYSQAQEGLLNREVHLSRNTGEIDELLKEIGRKGRFSFTYTSQIQSHRLATVQFKKQMVSDHLADIFRYDSIQIVEQNNKIILIQLSRKARTIRNFFSIKGLVIDSKSHKPLPYTNIFLTNTSIGTITNMGGRFELKIMPSETSDTLGISHIGYRMITYPISRLDTSSLVIRLSSEKVQIKEVVVKPQDPIYILTKAIEKIPDNYDRKPAVYTGFIRESTQQDNKNISLSEAIIKVFKEPYTSTREDQIKIYKGRKGNIKDAKEFVEYVVQGSLYNALQLDIVKNLPTFLDADYFALYEYRVERIISHFERLTYVISFDQREGVKYPCYKGRIYIDIETLAIVGATFELPEKGMSYSEGIYVKKSPRRFGVKPIHAYYQVFYRQYHNKWNVSNVRSELLIRVRRKKAKDQDKFNSMFTSISEYVITNKDTANIARFKTDEVSRPKDILEQQIGETDLSFWGDENIIIPDEPLEKTIIRLGGKNSFFSDKEIESIRIEEQKESGKPDESEIPKDLPTENITNEE